MARERPFTSWDDLPLLLDVAYAARLYGVSRPTLYKLCENQQVPCIKIGKQWRFRKEDVRKHLEENCAMKVG